jgi:hypothetical protein
MTSSAPSPWLSLPQAAEYARLSLPTLRRARRGAGVVY